MNPVDDVAMQDANPAPDAGPVPVTGPPLSALKDQLTAWQAAGVLDAATAARIEAFEAARPAAPRSSGGISVGEVIAYIGSVVLLVGVGFLYGTQYAALGSAGRLILIGVVVAAGLAAGELVRRAGAGGAARRARSAGWAVATLAAWAWFAEAFTDGHILTRPPQYAYPGTADDAGGAVMLAAIIGVVIGCALLWRAGAALIAFATAVLAFTFAGAADDYFQTTSNVWASESTWLVSAVAVALIGATLTPGSERRWSREVLRFATIVPPAFTALGWSLSDGGSLEFLAGFLALLAFGLAYLRSSAGYAIAGGITLFVVVNEVGFRHFAQSVGFPVVLIASGLTLFAVAGGLFGLLPRLRRSSERPA
jgi:hypothetical protein